MAAALRVRPMTAADASAVLAIYQAGLDGGQASFEAAAPAWAGFDAARLPEHRFVAEGPLVAEGPATGDGPATGAVLGWVAVSPVSDRFVYAGVVEHSVYVAPAARGRGSDGCCSTR